MTSKAIIVTGATGKQGGAVIKALSALSNPQFNIYALTRNAHSSQSQRILLNYPSVRLLDGDLDNPDAIFKSVSSPIWGIYSVQTPYGKKGGLESEVRQGKALVSAALRNKVQFFVYASVDRGGTHSDHNRTGPFPVPHFETKRQVEDHLREVTAGKQMRYTILRPTFFMENLTDDMQGRITAAAWKANVDSKRLQLVATSDIGHFAAQAFANPAEYAGRAISLAGDELTYAEASAIWREQLGSPIPTAWRLFAWTLLLAVTDIRYMFKWFREEGYGADIAELKRLHPELKDFATWLKSKRKEM